MGKKTCAALLAVLGCAGAVAAVGRPPASAGHGLRLTADPPAPWTGVAAWWRIQGPQWHVSALLPRAEGGGAGFRLSPTRKGLQLQPIGGDFTLQRNRTMLAAHWQPLSVGAWKLGTTLGYLKGMGAGRAGAMPMATLERAGYCVNLGWQPARGDRNPSLFMGVSVPLQ